MLAPYVAAGRLTLLLEHAAVAADVDGDRVRAVTVAEPAHGRQRVLDAPYFVDATELGDLLPLTGTEYVTGCEGRARDRRAARARRSPTPPTSRRSPLLRDGLRPGRGPHDRAARRVRLLARLRPAARAAVAGRAARPREHAIRVTLAAAASTASIPTGDQPSDLVNLWRYRRIADPANFLPGTYAGDITLVNWPQNDYWLGNLVGRRATKHAARTSTARSS